jgi:hypothetical protein
LTAPELTCSAGRTPKLLINGAIAVVVEAITPALLSLIAADERALWWAPAELALAACHGALTDPELRVGERGRQALISEAIAVVVEAIAAQLLCLVAI